MVLSPLPGARVTPQMDLFAWTSTDTGADGTDPALDCHRAAIRSGDITITP